MRHPEKVDTEPSVLPVDDQLETSITLQLFKEERSLDVLSDAPLPSQGFPTQAAASIPSNAMEVESQGDCIHGISSTVPGRVTSCAGAEGSIAVLVDCEACLQKSLKTLFAASEEADRAAAEELLDLVKDMGSEGLKIMASPCPLTYDRHSAYQY